MPDLPYSNDALAAENARLRRELDQARDQYSELRHRIKNELQIYTAIFAAQMRSARQPDHCRLCVSRIHAAAALHVTLDDGGPEDTCALAPLISLLAKNFEVAFDGRFTIVVNAEADARLVRERAQMVALLFAEALMNARKHAFPGDEAGEIHVRLRPQGGDAMELAVENDGAAFDPEAPNGEGVDYMKGLAGRLGGTLSFEPVTKGVRVLLAFPVGSGALA